MKNKKLRIAIDIFAIILGIIFLVFGIKDAINTFKKVEVPDSAIFKKSYQYVPKDNHYKYITIKEAKNISGVILVGNPEDTWTQILVEPLNSAISDDIYYLENKDLDKKSKDYKEILGLIDTKELSNPMIIFIKDGKVKKLYLKENIFDKDFEGAPIEYWSEESKNDFIDEMKENVKLIK